MSTKDYIEKDYYKALGVTKDAKAGDIKKAYRKLARELHPDKNPGDAKAEAQFKEISEAYDVLSDDTKRKEYDEARSLFGSGGMGGAFGRANSAGSYPGGASTFDMSDIFGTGGGTTDFSDLLGGLFTNTSGAGTRPRGGPTRGQDVTAQVSLSFDEAVRGATLPLELSGPGACKTCRGSGARPGTAPHRCPTCAGSGFISSNQGAFGFSEPCRDCLGTGQIVDDPCPECGGSGVTTQTRTITVRVPSGVRDGAKLRIAAKGTPGTRGGPPGDLFVTVRVGAHELFGRSGDDLTLTLPITFAEASLGTTVRVPTLDGSVAVRIAPGTPSGRTLRVRGRGVAKKNTAGDLLVTVEVAVPQKLTAPAREALEQYAAAQPDDPRPSITAALAGAARHRSKEHGHD
ncbi:MAG: molecular chaperone DnaJ [Pseudonocardiales bacterium]|nr:MAG: molecular chaperone DnaJ [Pseudonocardiales bacterium]